MKKLILLLLILVASFYKADAQKKPVAVYYLIDTASIPAADRIFYIRTNYNTYEYILNCSCLMPWLSDATFIRSVNNKGTILTQAQVDKLKLLTLRELIDIIVKYSVVRKKENIFYFIENREGRLLKYKVDLREPESEYDRERLLIVIPPK
jgi:hypothetical protein